MNKIFLSWDEVDQAANLIVNQIKKQNIRIDVVAGIPRGGLILAVLLSHRLNVPLILDPINCKKRMLIVDDISDTGKTLERIVRIINPLTYTFRPITATIHYKPGSRFIPDIYCYETEDWIVYPWETETTSKVDYENVD